ncbi:Smr/MutS family protein [Coraliomargarita algicola]|uniref:Smr/MutS family protein n=1 Tax=Coraliomargarita algicola TaxID=3092156 RepID=A0ABZ0RH34_9BACT|nr:Smr/MutS family protein [Coraliomargarita sp. J2-16]WPJ94252.1 Smr/MutS family protein [Coraliomargarita sp. J2-16]
MNQEPNDDPIEFEINGVLDLHTFRPSELGDLIPDYIELALEKGYHRIRIIHGKGIGTLRETVHTLLRRDTRVKSFQLADQSEGSWGATVVQLRWKKEGIKER